MVLRVCAAICGAAILFANSSSARAKLGTVNAHFHSGGMTANGGHAFDTSTAAGRRDVCATSRDKKRCIAARASMGVTIVGTASMYDPFQHGYDEGGIETASGELYDPMAWTAAIHTDLRETFGGVRYGKDYRPGLRRD